MMLNLDVSAGCTRNGWKLESVSRVKGDRSARRCVFVRIEPEYCRCGEPLPSSPLCHHCATQHLCWCAVGTRLTNTIHVDELKDWR